ncbi:MAG: hypothetical protein HY859_03065 [Caulobacterales bacterium]|nr:hypothetical protein [Caulobacterales bacterium]
MATRGVRSLTWLLGGVVLCTTSAGAAEPSAIHLDAGALEAIKVALDDVALADIRIYNPGLTLVRKEECWEVRVSGEPKVAGDKIYIPMPGTNSNITYRICNGEIVSRTRER